MKLALVGDIGGTNARFALWRDEKLESVRVLATADFASPEQAIGHYLAGLGLAVGSLGAVCLAVAGPVSGEHFRFTNNHWRLSRSASPPIGTLALGLAGVLLRLCADIVIHQRSTGFPNK